MPVLTGKLTADIGSDLVFLGNLKVGLLGSGNLHDYDWLSNVRGFRGYDFDDWTHHSLSETNLDRYVSFDVALGHNFIINSRNTLNIHGGFKYTNVKWTAYGGSYTYSVRDFRDDEGTLPNGKGISYEQRLPALFIGSNGPQIWNGGRSALSACRRYCFGQRHRRSLAARSTFHGII